MANSCVCFGFKMYEQRTVLNISNQTNIQLTQYLQQFNSICVHAKFASCVIKLQLTY